MPTKKLMEFLDREKVKYVTIRHSTAYTMSEIAALAHVPGKQVAKTVIVKLDGKMAMAVVPSPMHVSLDHLKELTGADSVELATEGEFMKLFPGCEVGAMPPFGNLYGLEVYVSPELGKYDEIAFNAGVHTDLVKLAYDDFVRLAKPKVQDFACA